MKHPKSSGKGSSHKPSSSSSAAAASSGGRKSRWESSSDNKPPSDRQPPSDPKPSSKPLNPKASPSAAGPPPPLHPAAAAAAAGSPFPGPGGPSDGPLQPPPYGFHNLERRTIVLADGTVRSYFALPPDYPLEPPPFAPGPRPGPDLGFDRHFPAPGGRFSPDDFRRPGPGPDYWASLGLDGPRPPMDGGGPGPSSLKRKFGDEDEFAWHRQHVLQYGNPPPPNPNGGDFFGRHDEMRMLKQVRLGGGEGYDDLPSRRGRMAEEDLPAVEGNVDRQALKRAFLRFVKGISENPAQRKNYLEDGKNEPLQCIVCGRTSKEFADVHNLIMHAYNSQNPDLRVDHLGLHKALCVLMGWNYAKVPENSKAYQSLSSDDATANREDLIVWPPCVIIHNTNSGRRKDGRMEGMGNKEMDMKLKELGFGGGRSKSIYNKEGHTGTTVVKFANTQAGLKDAERLAEFLEKDNHGRKGWARAEATRSGDDDKNPALVKLDEKTGEKKRIFYGYLATFSDLEKVDIDTRKRAIIKSRRELDLSD